MAHWLLAAASVRFSGVSRIFKGRATFLIHDGQIQWDNMNRLQIGLHDLLAALRLRAKMEDPSRI